MPVDAAKSGVSTDAAGRFQITSVVPGVYYVVVMPSSYGGRYLAAGYGAVRGNDPGKPITIASGAECAASTSRCLRRWRSKAASSTKPGSRCRGMPVFAARLRPGSDSAERLPT